MDHTMGESIKIGFDGFIMLEFRGAKVILNEGFFCLSRPG